MQAKGSGRFAALVVALLTGLVLPPAAGARFAAPPVELLPGFEAARSTNAAGPGALARHLPRRLARSARSAPRDAAAGAGEGRRVQVTLLELGKSAKARRIVARWGAGARRDRARARRARVGDGGWASAKDETTTVVWRAGGRVGVVRWRGSAPGSSIGPALAFARLANVNLAAVPETAQQRVLEDTRPDGTISKRTALRLFALAYGRVPGVRVPRGPPGEVEATFAAKWVLRHRGGLTAEQLRVVERRLALPSVRSSRGAGNVFLGVERDTALEDKVRAFVAAYYNRLPLGLPDFEVVAGYTGSALGKSGTATGETLSFEQDGSPGLQHYCRIRINDQEALATSPAYLEYTIAHESFHCVQNSILGPRVFDKEDVGNKGWVSEGMATWAGAELVPIAYQELGHLRNYVEAPWINPMFQWNSAYAAVGFFGHLDDTLPDYWTRVLDTMAQHTNITAFSAAGGYEPFAFESWASSRFRIPNAGPAWAMDSPLQGAYAMPTYDEVKPGGLHQIEGTGFVATPEFSTAPARVAAPAGHPIIRLKVKGHARLLPLLGPGSSAADRVIRDGEVWLCAEGSCECPEGHAGDTPDTEPFAFPAALALTGPAGAEIESFALEQFCQPPPPGSGDPLDCSGGCGSSNGDPHLRTGDGVPYDFQAAGEFTLASSPSGDLEVQARQQAARVLDDVPSDTLSVNTALAMRVARARVGVYSTKKGFRLEVDGRRAKTPAGGASLGLRGGGALAGRAGQLAVIWPDGSEARVWSVGSYGVATAFKPAPARAGQIAGLLGDFDGDPLDDFATRGGKQLAAEAVLGSGKPAFKTLYRKFGDSWRIGRRGSLFEYRRGRDTRDYTDRRFPRRPLSLSSIPADDRRRAEQICREAGVRDPVVLANCILDVAATGVAAFARDAVTLEATAKRSGSWTRLTSAIGPGYGGHPTLAAVGDRVVAVYPLGATALEAATFTPAPGGPIDVSRTTAVEGWQQIGNPFLLPAPGGGHQLFFNGSHSSDPGDPLTGSVLSQRRADGGFDPPVRAAEGYLPFLDAVTATPEGVPIWALFDLFSIEIWRGAQNATSNDLDGFASGVPLAIGVDDGGRLWLAWEDFSGPESTAELFIGRLDPATGSPAPGATPQQVPVGPADTFQPLRMACADACRLVFSDPQAEGRLLSWAPGEAGPTEVVAGGAVFGVAAAAAAGGRVWIAWADSDADGPLTMRAKLGDGAGAGGTPVALRPPDGQSFPGEVAALAVPGRLVLAVEWLAAESSTVWGAVVPGG